MAKSIIGIFTYLRYHILVGNMLKQIFIPIYLKRKINTLKWNCCIPDVFLDALNWQGWSKNVIFNLKFLITGFFGVGKFGKHVFGWLDLRRIFFFFFLAYSKQSEVTVFLCNVIDETKYVCECLDCFGMRFFFFCGDDFCPGIFCLVLLKALGIYLRFDFCPRRFDHPRHLKSCVSSWGRDTCIEDTNHKKDLLVKWAKVNVLDQENLQM